MLALDGTKLFFLLSLSKSFESAYNSGVMKRAVKWTSTASTSIDRQQGGKEQDGRRRLVEKGSGRRRPDGKEQDGRR